MEKAREALKEELNLIAIVRGMRMHKLALAYLLPYKVMAEFKQRTRYTVIDPD